MKRLTKTLIVDDSASVLDIMQAILNDYGIADVSQAVDGSKAVAQFEEALSAGSPYALVFLDIVMPRLDGQEALKRMRAAEKKAKVAPGERATIIMVTSLHSTDDMMHAIIDGDCDDYLVKPFEPAHLLHMLVKYGFRQA